MTALYFTIEAPKKGKTKLLFHCDVLAREDATDDEITIARSIQDALIGIVKQAAHELKTDAKTTISNDGDGYDRIRGRATESTS